MSLEKFFALYFPLKTKAVCTVKMAKRVTIVAVIILATFDSQFFFIMRTHKNRCEYIRVPENYTIIFNRIDAVIYSLGPFAIISLMNLAIIYKFVKAKLESERSSTTESTNQALSKSAMRGNRHFDHSFPHLYFVNWSRQSYIFNYEVSTPHSKLGYLSLCVYKS